MLPYLNRSFRNLMRRPSTGRFPKGEPPKAAEGYRGRIQYYPDLCINCGMCLRVCAPQCMERTIKPLENGDQEITFTFDLTSCTFCGMCSDFCSRKSITLSDDYMIVGSEPEDFIVSGTFVKKAPPPKMTPEQIAELKAKAEAAKAAKAAAAAGGAPAAPAAPATPAAPAAPAAPAEPAKPEPPADG